MQILDNAEKKELEGLNENPVLMSAIKKIFLAGIYSNGTIDEKPIEGIDFLKNYAYSLSFDANTGNEFARDNEALGAALRACNEALRLLAVSVKEIEKYKKVVVNTGVEMPAKHR